MLFLTPFVQSRREWKRSINTKIWDREKRVFSAMCLMYNNSKLYTDAIQYGKLWAWWQFCKYKPSYVTKYTLILRLATSNTVMNDYRRRRGVSNLCRQCILMVNDSVPRMLFECPGLSAVRDTRWALVLIECPPALEYEFRTCNIGDRTTLVLSGLGGYIQEWSGIYIRMCEFICSVYLEKTNLLSAL